jgi:fucose permease
VLCGAGSLIPAGCVRKVVAAVGTTFQSRISNDLFFYPMVRLIALSIILVCALVSGAGGADAPPVKRVLIISTGSRFSVGFPVVEQAALEKLRQLDTGELELQRRISGYRSLSERKLSAGFP